eukprot:s2501_g16.t2
MLTLRLMKSDNVSDFDKYLLCSGAFPHIGAETAVQTEMLARLESFIPTFCDDIMPYKYVLPLSEKDFMDRHKAGFWTRIMDDFAKGVARGEHRDLPYRSGPNKPVVSHLTHMNRHVPVTVLAVYADGTCDLEITELFMKKWEEQKSRKFAFFGKLRAEKGRYVLTKVPQILVGSVHYSGINIYDSASGFQL